MNGSEIEKGSWIRLLYEPIRVWGNISKTKIEEYRYRIESNSGKYSYSLRGPLPAKPRYNLRLTEWLLGTGQTCSEFHTYPYHDEFEVITDMEELALLNLMALGG